MPWSYQYDYMLSSQVHNFFYQRLPCWHSRFRMINYTKTTKDFMVPSTWGSVSLYLLTAFLLLHPSIVYRISIQTNTPLSHRIPYLWLSLDPRDSVLDAFTYSILFSLLGRQTWRPIRASAKRTQLLRHLLVHGAGTFPTLPKRISQRSTKFSPTTIKHFLEYPLFFFSFSLIIKHFQFWPSTGPA